MRTFWLFAVAACCNLVVPQFTLAQVRDASLEKLVTQLTDANVDARRDAAYELVRRVDDSKEVIQALGKATTDQDVQVRIQSLTALARVGKKSVIVVPELIKCLGDRDAQVRFRAAGALGAVGSPAIEPLTSIWEQASSETKIAAAQAFAIIGPEASAALPLLTKALEEPPAADSGAADRRNGRPGRRGYSQPPQSGLSRYAAEAVVSLSHHEETRLLKLAEHPDAEARKVGLEALAAIHNPSAATLQKLQDAVSDRDAKIRESAIVVVAKARVSPEVKTRLIELALVDTEVSVRAAALVAMRKAQLPVKEFAQRLATRLPTVDVEPANTILKAIAALGPDARDTFPALVTTTEREGMDKHLIASAMAALGAEIVPELLSAIDKQPKQEQVFSQALGLVGLPAVAALKQGMTSQVELVRIAATRALGGIRPINEAVLETIVPALDDPSPAVRQIAVSSLIAAAKQAEVAKAKLLLATQDEAPEVRAAAMPALRHFTYTSDESQSALERGLSDSAPAVRSSTLAVVSELPSLLRARLDQLIALIKDESAEVRSQAAQALGKLDKKLVDEKVVGACVTALGDQEPAVRLVATESVRALSISDQAVLSALEGNLTDDLVLLRATLEALTGFGDKASSVIPTVTRLTNHEKSDVRVAALNALAAIDKKPESLSPALQSALEDKDWEVRRVAGVALGKMGPAAKNAVPKLFSLLASDEDRDFASAALKEINTAPVEAIPLLISKLDSEERRTSFYAVSLLGKIGPPAAEALPKLEAMLAKPGGDPGRAEFRKKFLLEAIAAIKGETPK